MNLPTTPARDIPEDAKTDWFPANVKPEHIGVYEVERHGGICPSFGIHQLRWNGFTWEYAIRLGICDAGDYAAMHGGDHWRGLKEQTC